MKTHIKQPQAVSHTIQSKSKAANQADMHSVLQKYAVAQRAEMPDEDELLQGKFDVAQREELDDEEIVQGKFSDTVQRAENSQFSIPNSQLNKTGIPDTMKSGFENMSGFSFDDVRVHYNSDKPAQLQALAYTQGSEVHIAPGQEKHLGHELGHVVQQKQGRVQPTMQMKGVSVNDDEGLEREADGMEKKMMQFKNNRNTVIIQKRMIMPPIPVLQKVGERPFKDAYQPILKNAQWFPEAEKYEKNLGSYAYNHGKSKGALDAGIQKLQTTIEDYCKDSATQEEILKESFFKDDKKSAGQMGINLNVEEMLSVLDEGNLRERMTAFYNAAYYAGGYGSNLKKGFKAILHDIVFSDSSEKINELDLNKQEIEKQKRYYSSNYNTKGWVGWFANKALSTLIAEKAYLFDKDIFALGNLSLQSSMTDLYEIYESQKDRAERSDEEKKEHQKTPSDYEKMAAPLSDRELAFAFPEVKKPWWRIFTKETEFRRRETKDRKLPWTEGTACFEIKLENSWYKKIHENLRMPVVAGVSGTTTRMLSAYKFLNLDKLLDFRLAIMGWMLTSWDHSLYEIIRGSHIAGVEIPEEKERLKDVINMYMTVEPLQTSELRQNVATDKMFPHEIIYTRLTTEADITKEHLKAPTKKVADEAINNPNSNTTNKAHSIAIRGYTSGIHSLLNAVMGYRKFVAKRNIKSKLMKVVYACAEGEGNIEWIDILDPKKSEITEDLPTLLGKDKNNKIDELKKWIDSLTDLIYSELQLHANMTVEALNTLPSVNGLIVYRGDWKLKWFGEYEKGNTVKLSGFTSFTRQQATANNFASQYDNTNMSHGMRIDLELKGKYGKDIQHLSIYPREEEILLMPQAKIKLKDSKMENEIEVFTAEEVD